MAGLCLENDIVVNVATGEFIGFLVASPGPKTVTAENSNIMVETDRIKIPKPDGDVTYNILSVSGADPNVLIGTTKMILDGNIISWYDGSYNQVGRTIGTSKITIG